MAEVLNITFIKRQSTDETLDVICVNGRANGLVYPYTGNTLSLMFPTGNTYVSTFDGGSQGFKILSDHISRVTGDLISQTISNNLSYTFYQEKRSGLTHDEELFIEKLKEFDKTILDTKQGDLDTKRSRFASDLKTTYNTDDNFKNSSIPKIEQFLKNNGDIQKILTDNFFIADIVGRKAYGKGTVELDPMFTPFFPYRSSGGQHRRTRKKQI
jgi:hypothetical protein